MGVWVQAQAWDPQLVQLANTFKDRGGNIEPGQRAILLQRNRDLNLLAQAGLIDNPTYQACQRDFVEFSEARAAAAAEKFKVRFTVQETRGAAGRAQRDIGGNLQKTHPVYIPGTDSDYITGATHVDQVKDMKAFYNQQFEQGLKDLGGTPVEGTDWTQRNDVDFMGDANRSSTYQFELIAKENNAAYKRPGAARFEACSRSSRGNPARLVLSDTRDYIDEMQDMVHHREAMINADSAKLATVLPGSDEAKALEAEIFKNRAMQGKYLERIGVANDSLRVLLPPNSPAVHQTSTLGSKARVRDMLKNPHNPVLLASLKEDIINNQLREHAELLAAVAHANPGHARQCQASIAQLASSLSPQQKADVIASVRSQLGDDAARDIAKTLQGAKASATLNEALGAVRQGGSSLSDAMARSDGGRVRGLVAEMDEEISRARGYAGVGEGAERPLTRLNSSLAGMSDEELEGALRNNPALVEQIDDAVRAAQLDASLLDAYARSGDARKRGALYAMLREAADSQTVWGSLKHELIKANRVVPFDKLIGGVFAYWDVCAVEQRTVEGDVDGAARKKFEAVVSVGASIPLAMTVALTNALLDSAKEGGFGLVAHFQDAQDLLEGIIAVKGWENAEGVQRSPETSIDKLARNCTTVEQVRSIVATMAAAAAANSEDTPAIKRGKEAAVNAKCVDEVIRLWRVRRTQMAMAYIGKLNELQEQMDQLPLEIRCTPSPAVLSTNGGETWVEVEARADAKALATVNETLDRMKDELRALAGRRQLAGLRIHQTTLWTFQTNQTEEVRTLLLNRFESTPATTRIRVAEPGEYPVEVRIVWKIEVLNAIEGRGNHVTTRLNANAMLQSYENLFVEVRHEGDPVNTYQKEMERAVTARGLGFLQVKRAGDVAATPTPAPKPEPSSTPATTPKEEGDSVVQNSAAKAGEAASGFWDTLRNWIVAKPPPAEEQVKSSGNGKSQKPVAPSTPVAPPPARTPTVPPSAVVAQPPGPAVTDAVPPVTSSPASVTPPPPVAPVAKAPDVIGPRAPSLPALTLAAEVVYGTSQVIGENDWTSAEKAPRAPSKGLTETPVFYTPEELAAVQQAGQSSGTIRVGTDPANAARGKQTTGATRQSVSPLEEGITPSSSAPAPSPPPADATPAPAPTGRRYLFKSSPEMRFSPGESASPNTTITFTRSGRVTVWMEVVGPDGKLVGETKAAVVNVVPPRFTLVLQPTSGTKVGQEVEARIETVPPIAADLLDYRWQEPATANRLEKTPNASCVSFKVTGQPVTLHALARVPYFGDALGEVRQTYTGSEWSVVITAKRRGPVPPEWTAFPDAGGATTFATDEQFSLEAVLTGGKPPDGVRWKWTVNEGTTIANDAVSAPTVSRHEPGEIEASAEARDASGNLLGKADISVRVVSEDEFIKPLAITIKLAAPSVEVGTKTAARAEVTGGKPPYVLEWSPAGNGMQLELAPKEEGSLSIAATVRDARKKEARATASLTVTAVALEVSLKPDRSRALCGESVVLTATVVGGSKPYRFRWPPPATGNGDTGNFSSVEGGQKEVGVEVTDAKGRTAKAGTTIVVEPLTLAITGLQAKETAGVTRTAKAGDKLPRGVAVKFTTVPALPLNASAGSAEIRFAKPGSYEVHAAAYATIGGVEKTIAQAPPVKVEVVAEALKLVVDPLEMVVGTEGAARLVTAAGQPPRDVRAEWTFAEGAGGTASGVTATIRPDAPGSFPVSVQWKDAATGTALGQASATVTVKPLSFDITVDPVGAADFILRAKTSATIPNGVFFNWSATGAEFQGPQQGASVRVRTPAGGKAGATAIASNARRIEVGRASVNFDAPEKPDPSPQAQQHIEKGYQLEKAGNLEGACAEYGKAMKLVPNPEVQAHVAELQTRLSSHTAKVAEAQTLVQKGYQLESAGNLPGALREYDAALALTSDARLRAHGDELRAKLAEQARAADTGAAREAKIKELSEAWSDLHSQGRIEEAIAKLEELVALDDTPAWKLTLDNLRSLLKTKYANLSREERAVMIRADSASTDGLIHEQEGNDKAALASYEESRRIRDTPEVRGKVTELRSKLNLPVAGDAPPAAASPAADTGRYQQFYEKLARLKAEARQLTEAGRLDEAMKKVDEINALEVPKEGDASAAPPNSERVERETAAATAPAPVEAAPPVPASALNDLEIRRQMIATERELQRAFDASYGRMKGWANEASLMVKGTTLHATVVPLDTAAEKNVATVQPRVDAENVRMLGVAKEFLAKYKQLETQCRDTSDRAALKRRIDALQEAMAPPQ